MKHLTGKDIYENTDPDAYKALVAELKKGITYGEGVDYPYEWDEIEEYLPRLCEKYLEPGAVEFHLKSQHTQCGSPTARTFKRPVRVVPHRGMGRKPI